MNIKTNTIVKMVEDLIKSKAQHFELPSEQRAAPDIDEFWRLDMAYFDVEKLAVDILKTIEVGLTEHFIRDILKERSEDEPRGY